MTRPKPSPRQALLIALTSAASIACWSTPSLAQLAETPPQTEPAPQPERTPPASTDTIRLTDQERDRILNSNTIESAATARNERPSSERPAIHGELGVMIGSNGTRGAYGTAAIPLGDNAGAVVSFESSQFGGYRRNR